MRTVGVYLIFAAVVLRAIVIFMGESPFPSVIVFLALYGFLLFLETWSIQQKAWISRSHLAQLLYFFVQSGLIVGLLMRAWSEDFFALLFIPLSLDAVAFFGRRLGYLCIGLFSFALTAALLFSEEGSTFGAAMAMLYSGMCFLFGGYAHQVWKAEAAHNQNQQMFNELEVAHRQLQGYADQVTNLAIEHERNRLARDLHDSVTQTVFSMNLTAQSARLLLEKDANRAAGQLVHLEQLATNALSEIQSLVSQLRPRSIAEEGLPTALRQLAEEKEARDHLNVALRIHGEKSLSDVETLGLYSIAHEALTNVIKHSHVCEAVVSLSLDDDDNSSLEISDHGIGFDAQGTSDLQGHLGLVSMAERASEIGWQLCVESTRGQGTRILVSQNPASEAK